MRLLKIAVVALLLFGLSLPVTVSASAASQSTATQVQPRMNAQIQVGNQDSQIKFWHTNNPRERQNTVVGLSVLVMFGVIASWTRRRFY